MKIIEYSRSDNLYLVVFNLRFQLLSQKKINALKRASILVTSGNHILVLADKYQMGIIISELLEENIVLMYPNVTVFKIVFELTALRESGILYELFDRIGEIPILGFFTLGNYGYIVVRHKDAEKVSEALASLTERTPR